MKYLMQWTIPFKKDGFIEATETIIYHEPL